MGTNTKVGFFIVGQPKSGTSALANFLDQHPSICMANPKEPGYFAKDHIEENDLFKKGAFLKARSLEEYESHFALCAPGALKGEATTIYLYSKVAAQEIYNYNPDAKIVIMLRNPVEFLYSLHMQHVNDGSEDEVDFEEALRKEAARKEGEDLPERAVVPSHLFYLERAKYAEQIERFQKLFPRKNILIITMEDLQADNLGMYKKVLKFLGVDENFKPEIKHINGSAAPRSYKLHRLLNSPKIKKALYKKLGPRHYHKFKNSVAKLVIKEAPREPLNEQARLRLMDLTRPEVLKVDRLTKLNLAYKWGYNDKHH